MKRLNKGGITVTRDGYRSIMDDMGDDLIQSVRKNVAAGLEPRIVFDNLDFKVLANVILQNHRNSDMHWIAHFLTFDRVNSKDLDDSKPQVTDVKDFELIEYLLNKDELQKLRSDFIVLVARVLKEFFSFMEGLDESVIPKHISHRYLQLCFITISKNKQVINIPNFPHFYVVSLTIHYQKKYKTIGNNTYYLLFVNFRYSESMKDKSIIIGLPVVPFNQSKHSDVCQYLEHVQNLLIDIYKPEVKFIITDGFPFIELHLLTASCIIFVLHFIIQYCLETDEVKLHDYN